MKFLIDLNEFNFLIFVFRWSSFVKFREIRLVFGGGSHSGPRVSWVSLLLAEHIRPQVCYQQYRSEQEPRIDKSYLSFPECSSGYSVIN